MLKGGPPKRVMITGASKGLGRALALELAKRGHTIIGCARSQDMLQSLSSEITAPPSPLPSPSTSTTTPLNHLFQTLDVKNESSVKELAKLVAETNQIPDIIVNNAGTINKNNKLWLVPAEEFDMVIDTNIKGVANVMRHFLPLMIEQKHGIIVNVSSGWGKAAAANVAPYCASKWAIEGLTRAVAKELPPGLAVVALNPGVVNTDMLAICFGSSASLYQSPEAWAPIAANMILNLTAEDNGYSRDV